jgi:hypothetical protein
VLLQRITDIADPTVVYTAGSTLTAQDLNNADNQLRYGLQEFQDSVNAGGGVPDGDKGDISVGGNGTLWSIDAGAVTETKIGSGAVTETKIGSGAVTSAKILDGTIVNADINASAAIDYSKLNLTGSVVNADISASAEIAVSKLADGAARQLLQTDSAGTGVEWTDNVDIPGTLDVTGNTTLDGNLTVGGSFDVTSLNGGPLAGARNRIINGDMRIDQRNAGASVTSSGGGTFSVDRFASFASGGGAYTTQRSTDVPTGQGFVNSIASTVTTIDSPTGADYYIIQQSIEGFNTADLGWGTASAKSITISFWVKASITGTYTVAIRNGGNNRSYRAPYSITTANTWEQKIITAPGDTTGTWLTDNGTGIRLGFTLGAGADFIDTGNTWSALEDFAATGQTQWIATNGATFYITGVQLEPGTVATPFERRSYGQELALCQRYYGAQTSFLTVNGSMAHYFKVSMRAAPTVSISVGTAGGVTTEGFFSTSTSTSGAGTMTASAEL